MLLSYKPDDVVAAIDCSDNANAAFKSFLKKEVQKGDPLAKVVKAFRSTWMSNNPDRKLQFVQKNVDKYEGLFLNFTRYALYLAINDITAEVIEKHAEQFNETYEHTDNDIEIIEPDAFKSIAQEALTMFENGLRKHELPESNFLLSVLILSLFDDAVVPKIILIAKER